jgi:S-adenosylmethionine hydrolase
MTRPLITLTTDFGLGDNYVGAVKGAIKSICPEAEIVDITHLVDPQNITHGVYLTATSWPYFPGGTIHVAVVDPGVGTERRAILIAGPRGLYIGPDNGILTACLPQHSRPPTAGRIALPDGYRGFQLDNKDFYRAEPSHTFHARDIFGPVAAHLAHGAALDSVGSPISEITAIPLTTARSNGDELRGCVLHVDTFGNLITDIPSTMLSRNRVTVEVKGTTVSGLGRTYGEHNDLFALVTSDGWLAVAQPNGSAARQLGAGRGDTVLVRLG